MAAQNAGPVLSEPGNRFSRLSFKKELSKIPDLVLQNWWKFVNEFFKRFPSFCHTTPPRSGIKCIPLVRMIHGNRGQLPCQHGGGRDELTYSYPRLRRQMCGKAGPYR